MNVVAHQVPFDNFRFLVGGQLVKYFSKLAPQRAENPLYALHAPEVECISKGKARQPYEFGVKVSLAITEKQGLMVGARSFAGNPYSFRARRVSEDGVAFLDNVIYSVG